MRDETKRKNEILRQKLFRMVSVGVVDEPLNRAYDVISTVALVVNLLAAFLNTFDYLATSYRSIFADIEAVTVAFFAIDYVLRMYTAKYLYPGKSEPVALLRYFISFAGVIDLLSFLPYYLPVFFPAGAAAFRMFRVARIMRLFRINAYYDSLNVITEVLAKKKQQLLSSVFILAVLILASSLGMYSLEHEAQPEVFQNGFSGIWWAASTLLTVGYGDIFPITNAGRIVGIFITFLGVGVVAIPTGIISAGFVEQYTRLKRLGSGHKSDDVHFITLEISGRDKWANKTIKSLGLPKGAIIVAIERKGTTLVPHGDLELKQGDRLIIVAESLQDMVDVQLREETVTAASPWNGTKIRDLDISRQTFIVMVKRGKRTLIPRGELTLAENDVVLLYEKHGQRNAEADE